MAASTWVLHDSAKLKKGDGGINLNTDSFVLRLGSSASNVATTSVSDATTVTSELPTANGYTSGGEALTTSWTGSGNTVKFDFTDKVWNVVTADLVARFAYIVDTTVTPDEVLAHTVLDSTPADVTTTPGNDFTVTTPANGVFTE